MTCERIEEHLSELIDNELDSPTAEEVNRHLATCSACRKEFEELRLIVRQSSALPLLEPPDRLYWTIRNQARSIPRRPWFAPRKIGWVLVPALATAALMLFLFPRNRTETVKADLYARAPATDTGRPVAPPGEPAISEPVPVARAEIPPPRYAPRSERYSSPVRAEPEIIPVAAAPAMSAAVVQPISAPPQQLSANSEVLASMRSIQQALEEIEAALQENPSNPQVQVAYRITYQKGLELRQRYVLGAR